MMYQEFEELAGYHVNYSDYVNIIEPMYMATNLSKKEFVKTLNKKHFQRETEEQKREKLFKEMQAVAREWNEMYGIECSYPYEEKLRALAKEYFAGTLWNHWEIKRAWGQSKPTALGLTFWADDKYFKSNGGERLFS